MTFTQNIVLDIARESGAVVCAKQGDRDSRFLRCTVFANGVQTAVSGGTTVCINAKREADGASSSCIGTVNADGTVTVPVTPFMTDYAGEVSCSVSLTEAGAVLGTMAFRVIVYPQENAAHRITVYYVNASLTAGTYYLQIGGTAYSFTTSATVNAGGVIKFNAALTTAYAYASETSATPSQTMVITPSASGTQLVPTGEASIINTLINALAGKQDVIDADHKLTADLTCDGVQNKCFTAAEKTKLSGIEAEAQKNTVLSVNGRTGDVTGLAEADGSYEDMTVGHAEQMVSTTAIEDGVPYLFRSTAGGADVSEREKNMLVGGSIVWNQLIGNAQKSGASRTTDEKDHLDFRIREPVAPYTQYFVKPLYAPATVQTVFTCSADCDNVRFYHNGRLRNVDLFQLGRGLTKDHRYFFNVVFNGVDVTAENGVQWDNAFLVDLTALFGSAADTVTVDSFKAMFTKPYYAYHTGTLMSVNASAHVTVGFNGWDEQWESGALDANGAPTAQANAVRSKNHNRCLAKTTYYVKSPAAGTYICWYDAEQTYIGRNQIRNATVTSCDGAAYFKISVSDYGAAYRGDICVNLSMSGYRNGDYEPYEKNTYPLDGTLTLRGLAKKDANGRLYYDGDTYEADGTVTRYYAERAYQSGDETLADAVTDGVNTVYKLASPTVESALPYAETQKADDFGTEEYTVTEQSGVAVPVGHETVYRHNLRDKLQRLPDLPSLTGTYLVRYDGATGKSVMTAFPTAGTGTFVLKSVNGTLTWTEEVQE